MSDLTTLGPDLLIATGYGLVVAFTTMPVLSAIAVLLGTRRARNGAAFAIGYAAALAVLFVVASLGLTEVKVPQVRHPDGVLDLVLGILLIVIAAGILLWSRRPGERKPPAHRLMSWLQRLGPVASLLVGLQFAIHPENLVITVAAAHHTTGHGWISAVIVALWFCIVGTSTVVAPTIVYARSGDRGRATLERVQGWITAHGSTITVILLFAAGVIVTALGLWEILRAH